MTKTLVLGKQAVALTIDEVINRYEISNQAEGKVKPIIESVLLLGFIPGRRSVCQRLGL